MMLVLSREQGEEIIIGDNIRLTVVAIRGNQVRIGFTILSGMPLSEKNFGPNGEEMGTLAVRPTVLEAEL